MLLLILLNVLWAASFIAAKQALWEVGSTLPGRVGPCTLAFARFAPAALLLYLFLRIRRQSIVIRREDYPRFFLLGALGLTLTYGILYSGVSATTATESALLIAAEPIAVVILARLFLGEYLKSIQVWGMAVGFAGVYLIVSQGLRPHLSPSVIGNAVIAAALCFESAAGVLGKRLTDRYSGLVVVTVEMAVGAALLLPFALAEMVAHPSGALSWQAWIGIGYLALICSCLCYGVWFWLLSRYDLSAMAGSLFLQPMMGTLYGGLFLGERLHLWTAYGAALVLLGVWLVAYGGLRRRESHAAYQMAE